MFSAQVGIASPGGSATPSSSAMCTRLVDEAAAQPVAVVELDGVDDRRATTRSREG